MSKSALLLGPCLVWADPQSKWYDEERTDKEDTQKRDEGIAFHDAIDFYLKTDIVQSFGGTIVDRYLSKAIDWIKTSLGPRCDTIMSEVAIGVNWTTREAIIHKDVKGRNYPSIPGFQNGTADLVCILKTGELLVADWKTGGNDGADEQLLSLGCGLQKVAKDIGSIDGQMQWDKERPLVINCISVNEDGIWTHERTPSPTEIDNHWDAMRFRWEDIGKAEGSNHAPGVHCTTLYCPHLAYCSAISGSVAEQAATAPTSVYEPTVAKERLMETDITKDPYTDTEAGLQMATISAAKRQQKYKESKLKDYIKNGGHVVLNGYEWAEGNNGFRWRKQKSEA